MTLQMMSSEEAIKENKENAVVFKTTLAEMKQGHSQNNCSRWFRCVTCGEQKITEPIMRFFNWDYTKYQCYECQDNNRN
mgnify:CR=1 FL=1